MGVRNHGCVEGGRRCVLGDRQGGCGRDGLGCLDCRFLYLTNRDYATCLFCVPCRRSGIPTGIRGDAMDTLKEKLVDIGQRNENMATIPYEANVAPHMARHLRMCVMQACRLVSEDEGASTGSY